MNHALLLLLVLLLLVLVLLVVVVEIVTFSVELFPCNNVAIIKPLLFVRYTTQQKKV